MKGSVSLLIVVCIVVSVHAQSSDQITQLPGLNATINFKQYSGYINVNQHTDRNLFYWFVESQNSPSSDPVVLWLNGGPGCSSLGGFFTELGPFVPLSDGKSLSINPYSWNKVANVIFLESPSGVGFSYSTDKTDYIVGDVRTANDSYNFLLQFFQKYPQFAKNPFWITGESYGGHYVPTLAKRIVDGNKQNSQKINIAGFMAGNAWTDASFDNYGAAFFWYSHALISKATFDGLNTTCDFSRIGPLSATQKDACDQYQDKATTEMGNIDIYNIYADVCLSSNAKTLMRHLADSPSRLARFALNYAKAQNDPCVEDYMSTYLNNAAVKQAIHAKTSIHWNMCASLLAYSRADLLTSVIPVYRELIASKSIKMLVFSGDIDAIVPVTGSRFWIDSLNLPVVSAWRPWIGSNKQVGGYTTSYDGLDFLTVRGAGHMVPGVQPQRALDFFSRYLAGKPF